MDREQLFKETKSFMKGRWWDIFFIRLLFGVLSFLIVSTLVSFVFDPKWFTSLRFVQEVDPEHFEDFFIKVAASSAISSILVGLINGALSISILKAYQDDEKVSFSVVYKEMKKHAKTIILVLIVIAAIQFLLTSIPYLNYFSLFLLSVVNYITAFTYFIIHDEPQVNGIQALRLSYQKTKGHKLELFRITLHYYFRKFVGYFIVALGFIFVTIGVILSEGSVSSSIFLMLGFAKISIGISLNIFMAIKFGPYATVAFAIYYEKLKGA